MAECKTGMRAGGGSQLRPVGLRQRMNKDMSARKDHSLLGCALGEQPGQDWRVVIVQELFLLT